MSSSIADHAYELLAREIATCRLAPGALVNERSEAARLGMSRTPLRQALQLLELEGLIVTVAKRGTYVAPLDPMDIQDNMDVREAVEVATAQRVLMEGLFVDFKTLERHIAEQIAAIDRSDHLGFLRADEDFHQTLLGFAGNRRASAAVQRAWIHVNRARYLVPMSESQMLQAVQDHKDLVAAIRSGDVDGVRWVIRRHLGEALARTLKDLQDTHPEAFALPVRSEPAK